MYVVGTAGHVDHGKSLLVEALTGIDPDRLREEKARGMTIELGFAWLALPSGRTVSIVDVPGHERFIKNMLAGAGGVDVALLVIAADDGVMPQTREHLAVLDLLDVRRGVVAITKTDLVEADWASLVEADVRELIAPTTLAGSAIVRCSSVSRAGLDALREALDEAIGGLPPKRDVSRPRLPVDRVFTIGGFGTVVTGTLVDGELRVGDEVEFVPDGPRGRVRGLQSHRENEERALPGTRTAVNVAGVEKEAVQRGMVLARPGSVASATVVDARVEAVRDAPRALPHNARLTLHCLAAESPAVLRLLDRDELRPGEEGWAQIRVERPMAMSRGDRFVLRTPEDTVAGGVVVDVTPRRHRRGDAFVLAGLEAALHGSPLELVEAALSATRVWEPAEIAEASTLAMTEAAEGAGELVRQGRAVYVDAAHARVVGADVLRGVGEAAREALASFHRAHRLRRGMPQEELRGRLRLDARSFGEIAPLVEGVVVEGGIARLSEFAPRLTAEQRGQADAWLAWLRDGRHSTAVDPPDGVRGYLVERGEAIDAGDGVYFEAASFAKMAETVREHIRANGTITLAQARDLFGTNRRIAQALLEQLDRLGVTRRVGDARVSR